MEFKPMLLSNDTVQLEDKMLLNCVWSTKLDGVRVEITREGIFGRSLKPIRNRKIQDRFRPICKYLTNTEVLEAELWAPDKPCREIAGIANSKEKDITGLKLYVFDYFNTKMNDLNFRFRYPMAREKVSKIGHSDLVFVKQTGVLNLHDLEEIFAMIVSQGFEGIVIKHLDKPYKQGRVTIKEGIGYKLKPDIELDLEIIGVEERMKNTNESEINELGHKYKRDTVDAKEPTGIASTFVCKLPSGGETKVTLTGTESFRREVWERKADYIGRIAVVKSMNYGTKDKLRHPRLIRIKEEVEY